MFKELIAASLLLLTCFKGILVFPNAAGVIFRTSNYCIAFIVESTGENLIFVTVKNLQLVSCICRPYSARLVAARSNNLVTLRVKCNLTDLVFMSLQ